MKTGISYNILLFADEIMRYCLNYLSKSYNIGPTKTFEMKIQIILTEPFMVQHCVICILVKDFLSPSDFFHCSKQELQFYVDIITASQAAGCFKCASQDFTSNKLLPQGFLALFLLFLWQCLFCYAIFHPHKQLFIPSIHAWELSEQRVFNPFNFRKLISLFVYNVGI